MKIRLVSVLFIFTILLSACNFGENPKEHLGEIYSLALESIMEYDQALNSNMEFIAIDMSNFDGVTEEEKQVILNKFKDKYKVETIDATMNDLKEDGYYKSDTLSLDGILLRIEGVVFKSNSNVLFEVSKFKSAKGAVGAESTVHYKNKEWKIKKSKETRTS